ncbi:unnamed protein product [Didymodactylos carnosus]|uniref:UBA domain-containing protein n=1 Tax=Didymodactylos carnosus TaxID=1234261 RepID=A0A8S2GEB5_9BILA|nr:unnamed protein product [Didymodactylos carnosus]CAF3503674.1 unnamed protein product [Didymodactylos carnosus]
MCDNLIAIKSWNDLNQRYELLSNDKMKEVKIFMIDEENEEIRVSSETEFNENVMFARQHNVDTLKLIVYIGDDRVFDGIYYVPPQDKQVVIPIPEVVSCELEYRVKRIDINRDEEKIIFPKNKLNELDENVLADKWYIPCKADEALGLCLIAATNLAQQGLADLNDDCKHFIDIIVPDAFRKLQNTQCVFAWPSEIQFGIFKMLELFIDLVCARLQFLPVPTGLLETLALVSISLFYCFILLTFVSVHQTFDCNTTYQQKHKFEPYINCYNLNGCHFVKMQLNDGQLSYGWLRSLIDRFLMQDGIQKIQKQFDTDSLKAADYNALLKVFVNCKNCIVMERYRTLFSKHILQAIDYVKRATEDVSNLIKTLHTICINCMLTTYVDELESLMSPKQLTILAGQWTSVRLNSKKQRTDEDLFVQKPQLFDVVQPLINGGKKNNSTDEDIFLKEEFNCERHHHHHHHHHVMSPSLKRKYKRQNSDKQQQQHRRNTVAVITTSKHKDHEKKKDRRQIVSTSSSKHKLQVVEKYDRTNPDDILRFFALMKSKVANLYDHLETATFNGQIKDVLRMEEKIKLMKPYSALFVVDENIPDGTHVKPNEVFRKCWVLLNDGSLPWDATDVKLMNLSDNIEVVNEPHVPVTAPHARAQIYVDFIAPNHTGVFESKWILTYRHYTFGPMIWCSIEVVNEPVIIPYCETRLNDNIMMESTNTMTLSSASLNNYVSVSPSIMMSSRQDSCDSALRLTNSFDMIDIPLPICFDLTKPFKPKEMSTLSNNDYHHNDSTRTSITYSRLSSLPSSINGDVQDLVDPFGDDFLDEISSPQHQKQIEVNSNVYTKDIEHVTVEDVQQTLQEQESTIVQLPTSTAGEFNGSIPLPYTPLPMLQRTSSQPLDFVDSVVTNIFTVAKQAGSTAKAIFHTLQAYDETSVPTALPASSTIIEIPPQTSIASETATAELFNSDDYFSTIQHGENENECLISLLSSETTPCTSLSSVTSQTTNSSLDLNMAHLIEMGFLNREQNLRLLTQYKNDITKVIEFLADSSDYSTNVTTLSLINTLDNAVHDFSEVKVGIDMPKRKYQLSALVEESNVSQKQKKIDNSNTEEDILSTTSLESQQYQDTRSSRMCTHSDTVSEDMITSTNSLSKKQNKHSVRFEDVTVYYFNRSQGFVCVPSTGGTTLGMAHQHSHCESYTINDFARRQHQVHKSILCERKILPPTVSTIEQSLNDDDSTPITNIFNYCSDNDMYEKLPVDDCYFLQPISIRERRNLLKQSGINKIDNQEKKDLQLIRESRETCGCSCIAKCDPYTCECSQNGISCQVDRLSFPCACSKLECQNPYGRTEFNHIRVKNHFLNTIMRLELEEKSLQLDIKCNNINMTNMSKFEQCELVESCYNGENAHRSYDVMHPSPMMTIVDDSSLISETSLQLETEISSLLSSIINNVIEQYIRTTTETVVLSIVSSIEQKFQSQINEKKSDYRKSYRSSLFKKKLSSPPLSIKSNTHSYNTRTRCSNIIKINQLLTTEDLVPLTAE